MSLEDFSFGFLSRHRRTAISAPFSFFADFIIRDYLELERFFFAIVDIIAVSENSNENRS